MAIRVIENQPQVGRNTMVPLKNLNKPTAIQPDQVWHLLTDLQQHQVTHSLVRMGRELVQAIMQEAANEHH